MKRVVVLLALLIVTGVVAAAELDETGAVAVLQKLDAAKATDAELFDAAAACRRLTVIGTEKSVAVLEPLLADPKLGSYARTALENIKKPEAEASLKRHPAKVDNASPVSEKLVASRKQVEAIAAGGAEADAVFAKLLKSDDKVEFNAALEGFRKKPNVALLAKEQAGLKPERRVAAILSLLDLKDVKPLPAEIVEAAKSDENADVQAAAIAVLGKFPDEAAVDALFYLLKTYNLDLKVDHVMKTLYGALESAESPLVDKRIIEILEKNETGEPVLRACRLAGHRHLRQAADRMWEIQKKFSDGERMRILCAYGEMADRNGFIRLLEAYCNDLALLEEVGVMVGLQQCCMTSPDPNGYAQIVMEKMPVPKYQLILLNDLGGSEALKQITEIARKTDKDEVRDQATKILGEWTGAEVAPVLLELSASLTEEKYKVRTLRGFLRAVRQFEMPKDEKKKLCEKALDIATRDEEKKMIRDVMGRL